MFKNLGQVPFSQQDRDARGSPVGGGRAATLCVAAGVWFRGQQCCPPDDFNRSLQIKGSSGDQFSISFRIIELCFSLIFRFYSSH